MQEANELGCRGADTIKIDAIHTAIKSLIVNIDITATVVNAPSMRIQTLTDETLQPQLYELITGKKL